MAISNAEREARAAAIAAPSAGAPPGSSEEQLVAHEARKQEQAHEYGGYVATQDIYVGNGLAFVAGQPVPRGHVAKFGYDVVGVVDAVECGCGCSAQSKTRPAAGKGE